VYNIEMKNIMKLKPHIMKNTILIKSMILVFVLIAIQVNAQWELLDQTLPDSMALNTATTYEGKIYVIGGLNNPAWGSIATNKVRVFDTGQEIWLPDIPDFPTHKCGATSEVIHDKIYVVGGAPANYTLSNTLYEYDLSGSGTWVKKANMLTTRMFHTSVVLNDKIYVMGGRHNLDFNLPVDKSVEMYDPNLNTWTRVADMNAPRAIFSAEVVNGKIYAIGGVQSRDSTNHTIEVYDPQSNTWTLQTDMPLKRLWHGSVVINDNIYVYGGYISANDPMPNIWKFNPEQGGTWTELENTTLPDTLLWYADAAEEISPDTTCIYTFGGGFPNFYFYADNPSLPPPYITNAVYKFCIPTIVSTSSPDKSLIELSQIQIYPNPFSFSTNIKYSLEKREKVRLQVFNLSGQCISTIRENYEIPGEHEILLNAEEFPAGVYIFKLQAGNNVAFRKGILIK
jgi:hypothetical protein